jgi:hypothetical protein
MKIGTIMGILPTRKKAITRLSKLIETPLYWPDDLKTREMYLRRLVFHAADDIEKERKSAAQEKAALLSEVERLRAENEKLKTIAARSSD